MTQRGTTVLQPAHVSLHLSLAGAWTAAMLQRLDLARAATSALEPKTFDAFGAGMATVLAFYLALSHTREVTRRAPWVDSVPLDPDALEDLHRRAARFRDAFIHFGEKAERHFDFSPASAEPPGPSDIRRLVPRGAVVMAFGFEDGEAYLQASTARAAYSMSAHERRAHARFVVFLSIGVYR